MKKISPLLAGIAGEYFVAAELSRRGFIASISLRNTCGIDILATNNEASRSITIQCKTNQYGRKKWILNEKNAQFVSDSHFYIFVAFNEIEEHPQYHIVPSRDVQEQICMSHQEWLSQVGRGGKQHNDNKIRNFLDPEDIYLDKWNLLGLH